MNDSTAPGYLSAPPPDAAPQDGALDDALQSLVVGVTGLAGAMVRPRWQAVPPPMPGAGVDWCAVGVTSIRPIDYPVIVHDPAGEGSDVLRRQEDIDALASFYGPAAAANASALRDALYVWQNLETLADAGGLKLREAGELTRAPAMVANTWVSRWDVAIAFRREVRRIYPVRTIVSVTVLPDLGAVDAVLETDGGEPIEAAGVAAAVEWVT